jgi:neutral ceramidase
MRTFITLAVSSFIFASGSAPALTAEPGELRMGAAAVRITPLVGTPMAGYYATRLSEGTHDDLHAKALVFEQSGVKVAIVALDLVSLPRQTVEAARALIEQTTGVRGANVMISATHSHTGPVLSGRGERENIQGGNLPIATQYMDALPGRIAESVALAETRLTPARVSAGIGREENLSFNRRYFLKDGSVAWNPGKLNPNVVKPAGPIDPDVAVVYAESPTGKPLTTYVNFAMHLDTVGGLQFSSDYAYTLSTLLAGLKGPDMLTVFTIGAAGNVNHINVGSASRQSGYEEGARIGTILSGEVLKTYARLTPVTVTGLRVRTELVKLPLPRLGPGDVEKARAIAARYGGKDAPTFMDSVWAFKVLDVEARRGEAQEVEVQVIALGDQLAWVGLPGEAFVELGQAIKKTSPFPFTIVAGLANGSIGYIPDRAAYAQGAYEVVSARCDRGSGELLVDAASRLLQAANPAAAH